MAQTGIYTSLGDTALGNAAVSDGIAALFVPAVAQTGSTLSFALNTAYLVTSVKDLENLGVTAAGNAELHFQVSEFFEKSGNGAKLWVIGYANTASGLTDLLADEFADIIQSTIVTTFDNRPRIIGIVGNATIAGAVDDGDMIPAGVEAYAKSIQTILDNLFDESLRMQCTLDVMTIACTNATGIVDEQLATTLPNAADLNCSRVAIQLTTSTVGRQASVGQVLGIQAAASIATSIGSMTLGSASQVGYFLDSFGGAFINTNVALLNRAGYDDMGSKQYVFTRTRPQMSGVYYNDGATCNDSTMALSSLEFLRVGNAVCDSVERFFVDLINTLVPTDTTGEIDAAYKAATLADLDARYLQPRITRGEAQVIQVDFWAKDGNFIASRAIEVQVQIQPYASLRQVYIEAFFVSTI